MFLQVGYLKQIGYSGYPEEIPLLKLIATFETKGRLRVKIVDAVNKRYEVNVLDFLQTEDDILPVHDYDYTFVVNTDKSSKPGEHWLAFFYNKNGKCEFFDPLGFSPKYYNLDKYLETTSNEYYYNSQQIQGIFSEYCGYYCTLFI